MAAAAPQGADAADHDQNADIEMLQGVDDFLHRLRPPGRSQNGAAELMDLGHTARGQLQHVVAAARNEAAQAVADAQGGGHAVMVMSLHDDGPDDVVDARADAAAGDDGQLGVARIEKKPGPGTGLLEQHLPGPLGLQAFLGDAGQHRRPVGDERSALLGRVEAGFAEARHDGIAG